MLTPTTTDRTIPYNKPDITLEERKGTCLLIDLSVLTRNVLKTKTEKNIKIQKI
jgi:hypothetical protein